jgi:hypothetical protein
MFLMDSSDWSHSNYQSPVADGLDGFAGGQIVFGDIAIQQAARVKVGVVPSWLSGNLAFRDVW